jgi:surface polysaccharide O-acyltransferase-like enzyme
MVRASAGFLVVISHVFAPICSGMNNYTMSNWWFFNLFDSFMRPCASLYVMISGALFLGSPRKETYLQFIRRRCSRILAPFFVWSMIYAFLECRIRGDVFSWRGAILQFLQGPTEYHLWFMYLILGIYVITPFLRRIIQAASTAQILGIIGLWMGYLIAQFINPDLTWDGPGGTVLKYGGFFLLGYALDKTVLSRRKMAGIWLSWLAIVGVCAWATYVLTLRQGGKLDETFYGGATPLVALEAAAVFLILRHVDGLTLFQHPWVRKIISRLSRESYNVYLIHAFFIWAFTNGVLGFTLSHETPPLPARSSE